MFDTLRPFLISILVFVNATNGIAEQFESAVYMSPWLIEDKDISIYDTSEFVGWSVLEIFDRRIPDYVNDDLAIYKVSWKDGSSIEIQVSKEVFDHRSKEEVFEELVVPFAYKTGQLPFFLLNGIRRLVLMEGEERWSASLGSIYIHLDHIESDFRFVEEILLHEGGHASIDEHYENNAEWKIAQQKDSLSLSKYGADNIDTEDLAESIIFWLAIKYRSKRISSEDSTRIAEAMPHRLAFLESQDFEVYPLDQQNEFDYLYEMEWTDEKEFDLEGAMSFQEFLTKAGLVLLVVIAFFVIRYRSRSRAF